MTSFIIIYHRYITEALLLAILFNAFAPYLFRANFDKMRLFSRIGYFLFWMIWSALIFSGLMAFMFSGRAINTSLWIMIAGAVILGYLEGYRSSKSSKKWLSGQSALSLSFKILMAQAFVLGIVSYVAIVL